MRAISMAMHAESIIIPTLTLESSNGSHITIIINETFSNYRYGKYFRLSTIIARDCLPAVQLCQESLWLGDAVHYYVCGACNCTVCCACNCTACYACNCTACCVCNCTACYACNYTACYECNYTAYVVRATILHVMRAMILYVVHATILHVMCAIIQPRSICRRLRYAV